MVIKILVVVAVVVLVFLVIVAFQPSKFRVERSVAIIAPAATIFPQINDLRQAAVWSPWLKMDPNVKVVYEGPPAGVGASSNWAPIGWSGEHTRPACRLGRLARAIRTALGETPRAARGTRALPGPAETDPLH
jgi:hypothetical protein